MNQPSPVSPDSGCDVLLEMFLADDFIARVNVDDRNGLNGARQRVAELIEAAAPIAQHGEVSAKTLRRLREAYNACRAGETT